MSPTGAGVEDVVVACQRAGLFTTQALERFPTITLLVVREKGAQTTYLVTPDGDASAKTASLLASAIGATAHPAEAPVHVLVDTPSVRQLRFQSFSGTFRETQQGSDPAEQARMLASSMDDGQWLAITLRKPGQFEHRRHARWLKERMATFLPTHHSLTSDTLIASFYVGSNSDADSNSVLLQVSETMPGFDIPVRTGAPIKRTRLMAAWMVAAVAVWALGALPSSVATAFTAAFGKSFGDSATLAALTDAPIAFSSMLALPLVVIGYCVGRGWIPTADSQLRNALTVGLFPPPARYEIWRGKWTPPTSGKTDDDGRMVGMRQGNYPLSKRAFILGPHLPVLLTAPHAGAESGQRSTGARPVPPTMRHRIGPYLGRDELGNPVHLSSRDLGSGVFVTGRRGSGKALSLDTRVPTPSGWTTIGQLQVGDVVYGRDGQPCNVKYLSPVFENNDVYRVTFHDGQSVHADSNHQWVVTTKGGRKAVSESSRGSAYFNHVAALDEAERLEQYAQRFADSDESRIEDLLTIVNTQLQITRWKKYSGMYAALKMVDAPSVRRAGKVDYYPTGIALKSLALRIRQQYADAPSLKPAELVMSTAEMVAAGVTVTSRNEPNFAVRNTAPLDGPDSQLAIDPYILGAWLGDGTSNAGSLTVGFEDIDSTIELLTRASDFSISIKRERTAYRVTLGRPAPEQCLYGHDERGSGGCLVCARAGLLRTSQPMTNASLGMLLIAEGVKGNKHIPTKYLRGSYVQRLALLQGLMDTDGSISATHGDCELSLSNKRLAYDAYQLIRSLGIITSISEEPATINGRVVGARYRMHFTTDLTVFRMPRKAERLPSSVAERQQRLYIKSIDPVESVPVRCITVDSPDSTYLVEDFVPTHNTVLLHGLFAWACLDRVRPCGLPGSLGPNQAIIAFESKGEGATKYTQWAADVGDKATLIEVADADGWAIDLLDIPGSWNDRGLYLADMLKYVFDDGAIGPSSFMALASFGTAALALTESEEGRHVIKETPGVPDDAGLIEIMYILVGGLGDDVAVSLDASITTAIKRLEKETKHSEALSTASESLRPYYGGNAPSTRRDAVAPPRNKIYALMSIGHWWSGKRKSVTWDRILQSQKTLVVNTGPVTNLTSEHYGNTLPDELAKYMTGMLMYSLQKAIIRNCATWGSDGRGVSIFADELSQLAGSDSKVITWLHDQGRSFGVRSFFATQRSSQLSPEIRESVADYATNMYFRQGDGNFASTIAADLASDGSQWTQKDLVTLPRFTAAARTSIDDERQMPFTFKAHNFAADPSTFAEVQGWNDPVFTPDDDDDWDDD